MKEMPSSLWLKQNIKIQLEELKMAYKLVSTNGQVQYGIDEFFIDNKDDLEKLPKRSSMGS